MDKPAAEDSTKMSKFQISCLVAPPEVTVKNFRVNQPLGPSDFDVVFPPGATVMRQESSYLRTSLEGVSALAGYAAIVLNTYRKGFTLSTVTVFKGDQQNAVSAGERTILIRDQVTLTYRKGLQTLVVETQASLGHTPQSMAVSSCCPIQSIPMTSAT